MSAPRDPSVEREVELGSQADSMYRFRAVLVLEHIDGSSGGEGDVSDAIAGEIADEEAAFALVRRWRGRKRGDAFAPVVIDRTTVGIEYLIKAVAGPIKQVVMAGVVGVDSAK